MDHHCYPEEYSSYHSANVQDYYYGTADHHQNSGDQYQNPYWTEEDDTKSLGSFSQSSALEQSLTPISTCSVSSLGHLNNSGRNPGILLSSHHRKSENQPSTGVRKKGVGGRRKSEKPPSPTVMKKRRVAANAR